MKCECTNCQHAAWECNMCRKAFPGVLKLGRNKWPLCDECIANCIQNATSRKAILLHAWGR